MLETIGFLELNSIAKGVEAADLILKTAEVDLIFAKAGCPGKYYILFTGEVAAFCRVCGKTRFYAAVNRTDHPVSPILPAEFRSGTILFGRMENGALAPFESVIIVKE